MRFWQIFVATYLIPILACLVGLLCFRFLSEFAPPDPPRALRIDNSGTDPNHQVLFWAKFGIFSNSFDFEVREECIYMCMHPVRVSILHTYISLGSQPFPVVHNCARFDCAGEGTFEIGEGLG